MEGWKGGKVGRKDQIYDSSNPNLPIFQSQSSSSLLRFNQFMELYFAIDDAFNDHTLRRVSVAVIAGDKGCPAIVHGCRKLVTDRCWCQVVCTTHRQNHEPEGIISQCRTSIGHSIKHCGVGGNKLIGIFTQIARFRFGRKAATKETPSTAVPAVGINAALSQLSPPMKVAVIPISSFACRTANGTSGWSRY